MATQRSWRLVLSAVAAIASCGLEAGAQDAPTPAKMWLMDRMAEFEEYHFVREEPVAAELALEPHSLLNWSNPERGTAYGGLFLWTHQGQPQMIACAYEWKGSLKHEFHSLSTVPIAAQRGGEDLHRFGPGVEWAQLPNAPPPAAKRSLRLTQMRRLAERFRVLIGSNDNWTQTRLLTQPVFRSPEASDTDTAAFVFVQGTDPECVLLLESTKDGDWQYALARQTKFGLKAEWDEQVIWQREPNHRPKATPQTPFLVVVPG